MSKLELSETALEAVVNSAEAFLDEWYNRQGDIRDTLFCLQDLQTKIDTLFKI